MLQEFAWKESYRIERASDLLTPALVIYPDIVQSNIACTVELLDGDAGRWRAHIKTAKLDWTLRMLVARGVRNFKCATTLELLSACQCGAQDVLFAYPAMEANARRVSHIAEQFPDVRLSVLAEDKKQIRQWRGSRIGIFIDINPGMNRTGVEQSDAGRIVELAANVMHEGIEFRGLHYYDGQYGGLPEPQRSQQAHRGYHQLLCIVNKLAAEGVAVPEVVTAGTPTFPCSLSYSQFRENASLIHRVSPGTLVYGDATSFGQLPAEYGYGPAALVLTRVVSHPHQGMVTCDAGHKAVSADAGVPTCVVVGHPQLTPLSPSEEHLPMAVAIGGTRPELGEALFLLPRHVCPTVNNFDHAVLVRNGKVESVEKVSARGRELPISWLRPEAEPVER